ncbi:MULTISPECIES: hypothetical protein [Bacillus cereus group]|uniref:hypothetical protein n=1 Tax=Bacillus cereus group TaxID=86661 RepID=UPI001CBF721F|nr:MULTISPECIES: hypothetical protein [Bacillus cereus group]
MVCLESTYKKNSKFRELTTHNDFKSLKEGDMVSIEWEETSYFVVGKDKITTHLVIEINKFNELVVDDNRTVALNIDCYLMNQSHARKVYAIQ